MADKRNAIRNVFQVFCIVRIVRGHLLKSLCLSMIQLDLYLNYEIRDYFCMHLWIGGLPFEEVKNRVFTAFATVFVTSGFVNQGHSGSFKVSKIFVKQISSCSIHLGAGIAH